jgi:Lrp/AsnC family leucine-responsive transcriptional regulator
MTVRTSVRAIVRVRLAPWLRRESFEGWLRALHAVEWAALLTGDADYELHVECRSIADLGDTLTRIRGYRGVEVESSALVLHEVTGLVQQRRGPLDEVTVLRLRMM